MIKFWRVCGTPFLPQVPHWVLHTPWGGYGHGYGLCALRNIVLDTLDGFLWILERSNSFLISLATCSLRYNSSEIINCTFDPTLLSWFFIEISLEIFSELQFNVLFNFQSSKSIFLYYFYFIKRNFFLCTRTNFLLHTCHQSDKIFPVGFGVKNFGENTIILCYIPQVGMASRWNISSRLWGQEKFGVMFLFFITVVKQIFGSPYHIFSVQSHRSTLILSCVHQTSHFHKRFDAFDLCVQYLSHIPASMTAKRCF